MHLHRIGLCLLCVFSCIALACAGNSQVPRSHQEMKEVCEPFKIEPGPDITPAKRIGEYRNPTVPRQSTRTQGVACVHITISPEGQVVDTEVVFTDSPLFAEAFQEALLELKYEPATRGDEPIESKAMMSASFKRSTQRYVQR